MNVLVLESSLDAFDALLQSAGLRSFSMIPRSFLRYGTPPSCRLMSTKFRRTCVVHNSASRDGGADDSSVSMHSALQQQQLEFCCLLCGYDVPCSTCPFNWFGFDPRKFRNQRRRSRQDDNPSKFAASMADIRQAMETLGITASKEDLDQQQVKAAFRAKALEWHPDCNPEPEAEDIFKEILLAYELLLAHAR